MWDKFSDLTIGAFAGAAEVSVEAVRFYQRRGLLIEGVRECCTTTGTVFCPLISILQTP